MDDKDVDALEMGAVGGKGLVLGKTMTSGGESGSEDERYILGDEESTVGVGVAVAKGEAEQPDVSREREKEFDRHLNPANGGPGGIVKTTDVRVDYGRP